MVSSTPDLAGHRVKHRVGTDQVDATTDRPLPEHRQRVQQHAQHQLFALLRIERAAQAGLATGHGAHRQHDMDGLESGAAAGSFGGHRSHEW